MVQCYPNTLIHSNTHKEKNLIFQRFRLEESLLADFDSLTDTGCQLVQKVTQKKVMAIDDVLQTTSSVFSNNHNRADETCHVYRWSFPLSFSHFFLVMLSSASGEAYKKARQHKAPFPLCMTTDKHISQTCIFFVLSW